MREISVIVLFFFLFSLMPLPVMAAQKGKKKPPPKKEAVSQKKEVVVKEEGYLDLEKLPGVYFSLSLEDGEKLVNLGKDKNVVNNIINAKVKVIIYDGRGKKHEGLLPFDILGVIKDGKIIRIYPNEFSKGFPVLNDISFENIVNPQQIKGEELRIMLQSPKKDIILSQSQQKEEKPPPPKEPQQPFFAYLGLGGKETKPTSQSTKEKRCIDWDSVGLGLGTGFAVYGITSEQYGYTGIGIAIDIGSLYYGKKKKEEDKTSPACQILSALTGAGFGWVVGELIENDDSKKRRDSTGGESHSSNPF